VTAPVDPTLVTLPVDAPDEALVVPVVDDVLEESDPPSVGPAVEPVPSSVAVDAPVVPALRASLKKLLSPWEHAVISRPAISANKEERIMAPMVSRPGPRAQGCSCLIRGHSHLAGGGRIEPWGLVTTQSDAIVAPPDPDPSS
jgi:hypothetical protein